MREFKVTHFNMVELKEEFVEYEFFNTVEAAEDWATTKNVNAMKNGNTTNFIFATPSQDTNNEHKYEY